MELAKNLSLATDLLELKFGIPMDSLSAAPVVNLKMAITLIADIFSSIGCIMHCLFDCVKQFGMQNAIMMSKCVNKTLAVIKGNGPDPPLTCSMTSRVFLLMKSRNMHPMSSSLTSLMEPAVKTSIGF